jgi:signal transduction histidine kinase
MVTGSVAHELNQPLTAINNYCNGMVSRVKADSIVKDDLVAALQKTARQAERAADVVTMLVGDEYRVELGRLQSGTRQPRLELAQREAAVDHDTMDVPPVAGLDHRRVAAAAAAEAAEAHRHGAGLTSVLRAAG